MNTSDLSSNGFPDALPPFTAPLRKPLTVSRSDDVSMCIETVTGKLVNPTEPSVESIDVQDIAWSLSRIPRFAGHTITEVPYNVAQHSVYVSTLVENLLGARESFTDDPAVLVAANHLKRIGHIPALLLKALFHDGHEAYFGDVPSPIKRIPELTETFRLIEMKLDHVILMKLELDEVSDNEKLVIKFCDKLAQAIEGYQFMPSRGRNWCLPQPSLKLLQNFPAPLSPLESYEAFMNHYEYLREQ